MEAATGFIPGVQRDGDEVHIVTTIRFGGETPNNLYHYRYDTVNNTILTQDGTDLGAPPLGSTAFENDCKVYDSGRSHCAQARVGLDDNQRPHIVYTEETTDFVWRHIYWTGSSWSSPITIATKGGQRSTPALDITSGTNITS